VVGPCGAHEFAGITGYATFTLHAGLHDKFLGDPPTILVVQSHSEAQRNNISLEIILSELEKDTSKLTNIPPVVQFRYGTAQDGLIAAFGRQFKLQIQRGFARMQIFGIVIDSFCGLYYNNSNFTVAHQAFVRRLQRAGWVGTVARRLS